MIHRILLRKKSKEIGKYDLCHVVNARYFPDKENPDRSYIRLIVVLVHWYDSLDSMGSFETGLHLYIPFSQS